MVVIWFFLVWLVLNDGTTIIGAPTFQTMEECNLAVMNKNYGSEHINIPKDQIKALNQWTDYCEQVSIDLQKDGIF